MIILNLRCDLDTLNLRGGFGLERASQDDSYQPIFRVMLDRVGDLSRDAFVTLHD